MEATDTKDLSDILEEQEWMTPVAEGVQNTVTSAFEAGGAPGQTFKDFLHGVWLGHALHTALTDVPLGAWTVTFLLDSLDIVRGRDDFAKASDAALGVGLIGATGAAITGITDYSASGEQAPNTGLTHAALNIGATLLYVTSLLQRKNGARTGGRITALLGYSIVMASAYLGGKLVYSKGLGVDHAQREDLPEKWTPVLSEKELNDGEMKRALVGDIKVLLVRHGNDIHAIGEVCAHLGGPLAEGELKCEGEECSVRCPWHGSRFDVATGQVLDGPSTFRQPLFETRVRDGQIEITSASAS